MKHAVADQDEQPTDVFAVVRDLKQAPARTPRHWPARVSGFLAASLILGVAIVTFRDHGSLSWVTQVIPHHHKQVLTSPAVVVHHIRHHAHHAANLISPVSYAPAHTAAPVHHHHVPKPHHTPKPAPQQSSSPTPTASPAGSPSPSPTPTVPTPTAAPTPTPTPTPTA